MKLTDDQVAAAAERIRGGESVAVVADDLGVSKRWLRVLVTRSDPDAFNVIREAREAAQRTRAEAMAVEVRAGTPLRIVGEKHGGISHESVRQAVLAIDPDAIREGARARARATATGTTTPPDTRTYRRRCKVCGRQFTTTNRRRVTDTSECAAILGDTFRDAPAEARDDHQDYNAVSKLRSATSWETRNPALLRWAIRRADARHLWDRLTPEQRAAVDALRTRVLAGGQNRKAS